MRPERRYAWRRTFLLGVPAFVLALSVFVPNAMSFNGGTLLGLGLLAATALGAVADWERVRDFESRYGA